MSSQPLSRRNQYALIVIGTILGLVVGYLFGGKQPPKGTDVGDLMGNPITVTIREPGKPPVSLRVVRRGDAIKDSADPDRDHWRIIVTRQGSGDIFFCDTAIDPPK